MLYINDIGKCLRERIKGYTIKYCDEKVSNSEKTQLQMKHQEVRTLSVCPPEISSRSERLLKIISNL